MLAHDVSSGRSAGDEWLSADAISELTGGRAKANTVRSWWKTGALAYQVFPELGAKSNKRSSRAVVEQFLRRKLNLEVGAGGARSRSAAPEFHGGEHAGRVADLLDTVSSLRTSVDSMMEAFIGEAESVAQLSAAQAQVSRAQADADAARAAVDARRVEQLRHLQTTMRGYDMALSTHLQPSVFESGATESTESVDS
jgi:hypothetical protein